MEVRSIRNNEDIVYRNRTTAQVLIELFVNGCSYQVQQYMKTLRTYKQKERMLFDYINTFNEDQFRHFYDEYMDMDKEAKKDYIDSAINDGIYIHLDNLGETTPVFYRCIHALEKFPFIKEDDLYIRKWGREYKCLTKSFVGEMYILKYLRIQNSVNCWKQFAISSLIQGSTTIS